MKVDGPFGLDWAFNKTGSGWRAKVDSSEKEGKNWTAKKNRTG